MATLQPPPQRLLRTAAILLGVIGSIAGMLYPLLIYAWIYESYGFYLYDFAGAYPQLAYSLVASAAGLVGIIWVRGRPRDGSTVLLIVGVLLASLVISIGNLEFWVIGDLALRDLLSVIRVPAPLLLLTAGVILGTLSTSIRRRPILAMLTSVVTWNFLLLFPMIGPLVAPHPPTPRGFHSPVGFGWTQIWILSTFSLGLLSFIAGAIALDQKQKPTRSEKWIAIGSMASGVLTILMVSILGFAVL